MTYLEKRGSAAATPPQPRHHLQSLREAPRGGRQRGRADSSGATCYVEGSSEGARRPPVGRPSGAAGTRDCLTL